jgi:acetyl-CoA hydrolase
MFPQDLLFGYYTDNAKLDIAVIEAVAINKDGGIIPGPSVGASPGLRTMLTSNCTSIEVTYALQFH